MRRLGVRVLGLGFRGAECAGIRAGCVGAQTGVWVLGVLKVQTLRVGAPLLTVHIGSLVAVIDQEIQTLLKHPNIRDPLGLQLGLSNRAFERDRNPEFLVHRRTRKGTDLLNKHQGGDSSSCFGAEVMHLRRFSDSANQSLYVFVPSSPNGSDFPHHRILFSSETAISCLPFVTR